MPHRITLSVVRSLFVAISTLLLSAQLMAEEPLKLSPVNASQLAKSEAKKTTEPPTADESKIVLESLAKRYEELGSWEATFLQVEKSPGLSQELSSEGVFRFVLPNKFMLETKGPVSKRFVSNGTKAWYLEDNPKSKTRYFVRKFSDPKSLELERFLVFFRGLKKTKASERAFTVSGSFKKPNLEVTLVPKKESDFAEIKILFHNSEKYPKSLTFVDAVGGETILNIVKAQAIKKTKTEWFDFTIPKGAKVEE